MPIANASRPMGFIPHNMGGRANPIITIRPALGPRVGTGHTVTNDDLAIGDAYTLDAAGNVHRAGSVGAIDPVYGIVIGFRLAPDLRIPTPGPESIDYLSQAAAGTILGCEDPTQLYTVQCDNFYQVNVGGKFDLVDAVPDPTFRQSRQTLTVAVAGANFQAIDLNPSPADNAYGANCRARVRLLKTFNN